MSKRIRLTVKMILDYIKGYEEASYYPYHRTIPREIEQTILAWNETLFTVSELIGFLEQESPDKVIRHIKRSDSSHNWAKSLNQE